MSQCNQLSYNTISQKASGTITICLFYVILITLSLFEVPLSFVPLTYFNYCTKIVTTTVRGVLICP